MKVKEVLKIELEKVKPSKKDILELKKLSNNFIEKLKGELKEYEHGGEVFIGGSFAKGTLMKKDSYDIDVFVRFSWKYDDISDLLEKPLRNIVKRERLEMERLHGSRDYFRIYSKNHKAYFEVIPVTKIRRPSEERNVTDLSYFHVAYGKRKLKGLEDEVIIAKAFFHTQGVYGAETYVRGFSGHALELLIMHYKSFEKMLKELCKVKKGERIIIDMEKHYKGRNALIELNEAKLQSPIILIEPTYKERNALASLSRETFERLQDSARGFLKKPSKAYFEERKLDAEKLRKIAKNKKAEFMHIRISTDRQPGDIAGTKLKKFHYFIEKEIRKYFELLEHHFVYSGKQDADVYLIVKSKGEIVQIGPPMHTKQLRKHIKAFKERHPGRTFVRNNILHARIKVDFTGKEFIGKMDRDKDLLSEMGITEMKIL